MAFRGWRAEALEFFEELAFENTKVWWLAHKPFYDEQVRGPMEALLAELQPEWGDGKIFRPYRDVRFSADKTPYKTHIGATVGTGYVQLSAEGLAAGAGMWEMAPDQLLRYREAVDDDGTGEALASLVSDARSAGLEIMGYGVLKTAPHGYPKDHPRIELAPPATLVAVRIGGSTASASGRELEALYDDRTRTIYLPWGWTGATPAELSVLVHEMVHHLQNVGGLKYECPEAREKPAYAAQDKWLSLFGRNLVDEFELDPMTVLVRTKCMH